MGWNKAVTDRWQNNCITSQYPVVQNEILFITHFLKYLYSLLYSFIYLFKFV